MMDQMARMMKDISAMMQEGLSAEAMREMSEITKDMSTQMMDMSQMFGRDDVSQEEMQDLQRRMMEMENQLRIMK
jgi:hypothetical protein